MLVFEFGTLNGGEHSMLAVLPQFVGTEFELVALAPAAGRLATSLANLGVPTIPFDVREPGGERKSQERIVEDLNAAIRRVHPDLVHANSLTMGRLTGAIAGQSGIICTAHVRDMMNLSAAAVGQLNANRALIAVSGAVLDFHAAQGVERSRILVVYNGIDSREPPPAERGWLKDELRLPPDAFLVAAIGQICLRKGQDVFARAASQAAPQIRSAHFLLIGERHSAKIESAVYDESLTFEFAVGKLTQRFHRLGYRADVDRLLPELDLIVHCARQEPFARVLLEAAAAGRPIIATAVGGTGEMLEHEKSAILVPPDSPDTVASAMVRLSGDLEFRSRLGAAAREQVIARFPVEKAARGLADVWRTAIGR